VSVRGYDVVGVRSGSGLLDFILALLSDMGMGTIILLCLQIL
jgi:hypothetical protein